MGPPVFKARFKFFQLLWKEKTSVFDAVNYHHENLEQKIHLNDCNAFFYVFLTFWGTRRNETRNSNATTTVFLKKSSKLAWVQICRPFKKAFWDLNKKLQAELWYVLCVGEHFWKYPGHLQPSRDTLEKV